MANPLVDIAFHASVIKATAPAPFKLLCEALLALEQQTHSELAAADTTHDIFRAQGKLKLIQQLYKQLSQCAELRDGYQRREKNG